MRREPTGGRHGWKIQTWWCRGSEQHKSQEATVETGKHRLLGNTDGNIGVPWLGLEQIKLPNGGSKTQN